MRRVWLFCATLLVSAGVSACNDGNDDPEDCDDGEVLIDGTCCVDDNNNGVCDDSEQTEDDCEDDEVLIDGVCCIDDNDNGVCDDDEQTEDDCEDDEVLIDGVCCIDDNNNDVCDDDEQTEDDCEDDEVLIDGVCCIDADENDVCDQDECNEDESWVDDACCTDVNNNDICDADEDGRTIEGTAVENMGDPLKDATVYLNKDFANSVTTDDAGKFSFDDVGVVYSLTIAHTNDLDRTDIQHHEGIMTDAPIITNGQASLLKTVQLDGEVDLDDANFDTDEAGISVLLGVDSATGRTIHPATNGSLAGAPYQWAGGDAITTTVKPLAVDLSEQYVIDYLQTGDAKSFDFTVGDITEIEDIALTTDIDQVSVTIEPDAGGYAQVQGLMLREVLEDDIFYTVNFAPDLSLLPNPVDFNILEDGGIVTMFAIDQTGDYNATCSVAQIVQEGTEVIACADEPVAVPTNLVHEEEDVPVDTTIEWDAVDEAAFYMIQVQPTVYNSGDSKLSFILPGDQTIADLSDFEDIFTLDDERDYRLSIDAYVHDDVTLDDYYTDLGPSADKLQTPRANAVLYGSWFEITTEEL